MSTNLSSLYEKCLAGTATAAEKAELLAMLNDPAHEETVKGSIARLLEAEKELQSIAPETLAAMVQSIVHADEEVVTAPRVHFMRRWWAAASIIVLLSAGAYFWFSEIRHSTPDIIQAADVQPGHEGAILALADGSHVSLDTFQQGVVALQGGAVAKVANGTLLYEGNGEQIVYNTMITPKGRQFQLVLPDGTKVWLNAASSIRYPTAFTGKQRLVEITGEAYLEVTKNAKMPFRVSLHNKAAIEVLGTNFNVNAYSNEASINTTLLEGAVRVTSGTHPAVILKPGQQARVTNTSSIKVIADIDVAKVTAWKDGYFNFTGLTFEEVVRQLERWYDIEVVFEKGVPQKRFGGKMTKDVPLSAVMKYLEGIGIHYQLKGKKLIILP